MKSWKYASLAASAVLFAGCNMMIPPEEDPLYIKMIEIDNRLARLERVVNNEGLMNLMSQLEALEKDVQALRNDSELLQNEQQTASGRQRDLYVDLDQRLQAIEQSGLRSDELFVLEGGSLSPGFR